MAVAPPVKLSVIVDAVSPSKLVDTVSALDVCVTVAKKSIIAVAQ